MKKIITCLLVLCFILPFSVSAYEWTYVGQESSGHKIYIDTSLITNIDNDRKRVFIKIINPAQDVYHVISAIIHKDEKFPNGNLSFGSAEIYSSKDNSFLGRNDSYVAQPMDTRTGVPSKIYDLVWGKSTRDEVAFKNGFINGFGRILVFVVIGMFIFGAKSIWKEIKERNKEV